MTVEPWVLNLERFAIRRPINNEEARLIPNGHKESFPVNVNYLSHVLASEHFIIRKIELALIVLSEVEAVATPECVLLGSICFDYLIDVTG